MKVPIEFRYATAAASTGAAIGCILGSIAGPEYNLLVFWTVIGASVGALIGFIIGGVSTEAGSEKQGHGFTETSERLNLFTGLVFVASGVIALLITGWDLRLFLATLFFVFGTIWIKYFR